MKDSKILAQELIDFLYDSPTAFQGVQNLQELLDKNGFEKLKPCKEWNLEVGKKYYITQNHSALIAFVMGENVAENGFKLIGGHTDSPGLKIKPNPEITENNYLKLNVEVYGGPILSTWFDRPLAIAGRVTLKSENPLKPKNIFVNINKPLMVVPNLAIHMNREVNNGFKINKQVDMLPMLSLVEKTFEKENYLLKLISEEENIKLEDILDFDLYLYEYEKGRLFGVNEEFISSSRIDNLSMCYAGIKALINAKTSKATNVMVCFDNEEIGSTTKQGADSNILRNLLERIATTTGKGKEDFFRALHKSFIISADGAHAIHPNHSEKSDPVNKPAINGGLTIKYSANQKYTSDSNSASTLKMLCENAGVPCQSFVNHSNEVGGSTIGPVSAAHVDIKSVDFGVAMLGMHSIRETMGREDYYYTAKVFEEFFSL